MHQILETIANDLKISQMPDEQKGHYEARIIYSAMAQHIKTVSLDRSIYETSYSNGASIVHTIKRSCDIFEQLLLCSEYNAKEWFEKNTKDNIEIMYNRLISSGEMLKFYDKYNIVAGQKQFIINNQYCYFRGIACNYANKNASGLALLEKTVNPNADALNIDVLLPFSFVNSVDFWHKYIHSIGWEELYPTENIECFNPKLKSRKLYDCFVKTDVIPEGYSLARKPFINNDFYFYILKRKKDVILYHQIEEYYKTTKEHFRFRYALRALNGNPVVAEFKVNDDMAELHLNSMLPNTEMAFLNLISWSSNNINDKFNYTFSIVFLDLIKKIFSSLDIKLMEKKYATV